MDYLPLLFNVLLLLFWVRLWTAPSKEFYFNPFLSGTVRMTDSVLAFLRPVLFLPEQAAACVIVLFIVAFKTLLMARLNVPWTLTFGIGYTFAPAATTAPPWQPFLLFSAFHFVSFLLKFWSVYLLVRLITPVHRITRATEAFGFFARPFSYLPLVLQPFVLLALNVALAYAVSRTGVLTLINPVNQETKVVLDSPFIAGPLITQTLRTAWLGALAMADGLEVLIRALFVLILGNLAAALFQMASMLLLCNEGVELLMGRFARSRAATGLGLDFTPLIFFFVIDMIYRGVCFGLVNLINSPLLP